MHLVPIAKDCPDYRITSEKDDPLANLKQKTSTKPASPLLTGFEGYSHQTKPFVFLFVRPVHS
jgi:hypothetical protein